VGDTPDRGAEPRAPAGPAASVAASVEAPDEDSSTEVTQRPVSRPSLRRITRPSMILDLEEGTPVGEYEIQAQIGEGAMGTVYSAVHPLIGKTVAIKVLKPELCANQASIDRFVQEAQAVNRIGHPNIVDVFSLGELEDGRAYMVMEWLRGEDLKVRLARGPMGVPEACEILDGIARALEAAHAKDIIHRDLKPDNVFLHQIESGPMMVKLLDFGIAKLVRTQTMEKTQTGKMLGTPAYISPEQARGIDVTYRSDIYSLGVMAYEMFSGRPPFQGDSAMDLVVKHMNEPPPPLSPLVRLPRPLEVCVMRMLDKDPAMRPSLEDVRMILADPTRRVSSLLTMRTRPKPKPKRRRWPKALLGLVVIAGVATATWQVLERQRAREAEAEAPVPAPAVAAAPQAGALAPQPQAPAQPGEAPAQPAPDPGLGQLEITVTGSKDAVISIDDVERGRGSVLKVDVRVGSHTIEVKPPRGTAIRRTIDVVSGQPNKVDVAVAAPRPPVVRPAPRPIVRPKPPPVRPKPPPPDEDDLLRPKGHP
jgi:serine/threonine protein kinase